MKPIVACMTAAALLAGPMLGCKSEKREEAQVTEPAAVETDEPFVLHLVEVQVRELDEAGQPGQMTGQPGQMTGQPGQMTDQQGQQTGQQGQQTGQQGQQTGQQGQQTGQQDTTAAAAARGQGTTGDRDDRDEQQKGTDRDRDRDTTAATAKTGEQAGKAGQTTTAAATTGQDDDGMKPLSHARKELQQFENKVDKLVPQVAENLEEAAEVGNFIEVTDGVRIAGEKKIELPRSVKVKMDAWDQTEADVSTRVCVSREGQPMSVTITETSGFQEADEKVRETILNTWRYKPYLANGQPIPVCERITFRYQLPDADTTKPVLF